jgi:lipoprotein-releasing system permease protein
MYKLLLCFRYLQTRYLALACIISVALGVATLIVVNSVMGGFSTKLRERLHALLSDVLIESPTIEGFADPEEKMERIRQDPFLRERVVAMTPTLEIFAMLQFEVPGETIPPRPVRLIGIDPASRARVGGFAEHLVRQKNADRPSFELTEEAKEQYTWRHPPFQVPLPEPTPLGPNDPPPPEPPPTPFRMPEGAIVGNAIAHIRMKHVHADAETKDVCILPLGAEIILTTLSGQRLAPVYDRFVVCDYFKSEMSEYDSQFVFVPLAYLQKLRTMQDRVTSIQLRLKDYRDAKLVVSRLTEMFPPSHYQVQTWEDKQGPLLAAISIEKGILNILLFLIIGVAGFGILAIFTMIVVEKTRDIGILKALGASNGGVMKIFLGYSLLLGLVGAGVGTALGLAITLNINEIEKFIGRLTGQDIFDRSVYYFDKIPTDPQFGSIFLVNAGSVAIAVLFSLLPSLRAALLHPVRALRYE